MNEQESPENSARAKSSSRGRSVASTIAFLAILACSYLSVAFLLSSVQIGSRSALNVIIGNLLVTPAGGHGQSLRRFREADDFGPVDVLFVGSSHTYRSFDPRRFEQLGLTSYNLGSTAQAPLNTYYLLKRYAPQFQPRLAIVELYYGVLQTDGLESFFDLCTNLPISPELAEMAAAVRHPHAINCLAGTLLQRLRAPYGSLTQREIEGETYVPGGYCESFGVWEEGRDAAEPIEIRIRAQQVRYAGRFLYSLKQRGCEVLLVVQPLPEDVLDRVVNYDEYSEAIRTLARQAGVDLVDFNSVLRLDSGTDFKDDHHLNAYGVRKFDDALIQYLAERGYLARLGVEGPGSQGSLAHASPGAAGPTEGR